jgi:hypothetical protein
MREKNIRVFYGIRAPSMRIAILGYAGVRHVWRTSTQKTLDVKIYFPDVYFEGGSNPFLNYPTTS